MAICNDILNNNKLVNEYNINIDNLVIDNIKINEIINELKSKIKELKLENNNQNIKIENLEQENTNLKDEIKELKLENNNQNIKIEKLEQENTNLKDEIKNQNIKIENLEQENKELKLENKELKEKINKIENIFYMTKIITALQDLNSCDKLEIKLSKSFKKLRNNRNICNHYIYDDDDIDNINKKKTYLLNQLINISEDIKTNINNIYGKNLIETIIEYLKDNTDTNSEVSEEDLSYIETLWEY